jgi:hypothetical protein
MPSFIEALNALGAWLAENFWRLSVELLILAGIVAAVIVVLRIRSPRVPNPWRRC